LRSVLFILFVLGGVSLALVQSEEINSDTQRLVPYTDDSNVEFTEHGRINYDLLIAKIMPEIFVEKLQDLGSNISIQDIVLERGFQNLVYEPHSYNCGYAIDYEKNKAYWLEAAINGTHIQYAEIYDEIPRDPEREISFHHDCFALLETGVAEVLLKEKSYFTSDEEAKAAAAVKHHLRGNENLNSYQIKIGKFNHDFNKGDVFSICGEFVGRGAGSKYFMAIMHGSGQFSFTLEQKMSPLCAMKDNSTLHDIKFKENPQRDKSLQSWKNNRLETVFLKPASSEKLLERNYLRTQSTPNLNLEYSTSFGVDFIDYRPEESGTLFYFEPLEHDTFAKFRVPQNGANYYMHYGPNDWNEGDITDVVISVEDDDPQYKQQAFVRSPEAPYPQHFTDYIFKVPKGSTMMAIVLEIENYKIDDDNDPNEWNGRDLRK